MGVGRGLLGLVLVSRPTLCLCVAVTVVFGTLISSPGAEATTCSISNRAATVGGQTPDINVSPDNCSATVSGNSFGSSVSGNFVLGDGKITAFEMNVGDVTINLGGSDTHAVTASIPNPIAAFFGQSAVKIGNITYDLSSAYLTVKGTASVKINNDQAADDTVSLSSTSTVNDYVVGSTTKAAPPGLTQSTPPLACPPTGFKCPAPGFNTPWTEVIQLQGVPAGMSGVLFDLSMQGVFRLDTGPGASTTIDASDPFEVDTMALLDANGQIIPGVVFTGDDGVVFATEGAPAAVPEPGALSLFGFSVASLLLVRRRKLSMKSTGRG